MAATNDLMSHLFGGQSTAHYTPGPNGELPAGVSGGGGTTTNDLIPYLFGYPPGGGWTMSPWYKPTPQPDGTILYSSGSRGGVEYLFNPKTGKWSMRQGGVMNSQWTPTQQPSWYSGDDENTNQLYPPPPITTVPDTANWDTSKIMDPRQLPMWLFEQFPSNYAYYDNLQKGLLDESWQGQKQAMETYNARQQEMSKLFNDQTAGLNAALANTKKQAALAQQEANSGSKAGLAAYQNAANQYQGYLSQALALQNEALKSNPQKYQQYIDSGTLPSGIDANLRAQKDTAIAAAKTALDRQAAKTLAGLKQTASGMGMQDSDYAALTRAKLANDAGATLSNVIDSQNNQYLTTRLEQPYKMQNAAISTMQSYNPFIQNIMSGGQAAATNTQKLGQSLIDSSAQNAALRLKGAQLAGDQANANFGSIMSAGNQQMQYPLSYYSMASSLPSNAASARSGYLNTMLEVWKSLLSNDTANAQINAQGDDGGFFDWLFG